MIDVVAVQEIRVVALQKRFELVFEEQTDCVLTNATRCPKTQLEETVKSSGRVRKIGSERTYPERVADQCEFFFVFICPLLHRLCC